MSILKVRVPLTQDGKLISVEWLRLLQQIETLAGGGSSSVDLSAAIAAIESEIDSLETDLAEVLRRLQKLENAYHS